MYHTNHQKGVAKEATPSCCPFGNGPNNSASPRFSGATCVLPTLSQPTTKHQQEVKLKSVKALQTHRDLLLELYGMLHVFQVGQKKQNAGSIKKITFGMR